MIQTTATSRKQKFLSTTFSDIDTSNQSEFTNSIMDRLTNNLYIKIWCIQNGLNFANDSQYFNAAASAFANYFIK